MNMTFLKKIGSELGILFNKSGVEAPAENKDLLSEIIGGEGQLGKIGDGFTSTTQSEPESEEQTPATASMPKAQNPEIKHEGLDRRLSVITVSEGLRYDAPKVIGELKEIGEEVGFEVQTVETSSGAFKEDVWVEDTTIRRSDGKVYIPNTANMPSREINYRDEEESEKLEGYMEKIKEITSSRVQFSDTAQGRVADSMGNAEKYLNSIPDEDKVYGKSYLEGGNVLNTKLADGSPGAVIGEESIGYTMIAMGLEENTPENREIAKSAIAEDLGLKPENVTYIPQFDFHIDMAYRPLQNGVMAVPDFESGIDMVQDLLKNPELSEVERTKLERLQSGMAAMSEKTEQQRNKAQDALTQAGYETVKVPCFNYFEEPLPPLVFDGSMDVKTQMQQSKLRAQEEKLREKTKPPEVNFLNGVGGTAKDGKTYYITNNSDVPGLNSSMEQYLKDNAKIDKIFFASTNFLLTGQGGLDCITQEY